MSQFLAIMASVGLVFVVILYFRQVVMGTSVPNPATWFIWALATTMNAFTYFLVLRGDWLKSSFSFVVAVGLCSVFVYSLVRGKFAALGRVDALTLVLCVGIGVFWQLSKNAVLSNLALQVILLVSFIPTIIGLLRGRLREKIWPWVVAVLAHSCQTAALLLDWGNQHWASVAFPVVNGIVGNGMISAIIILQSHGMLRPANPKIAGIDKSYRPIR